MRRNQGLPACLEDGAECITFQASMDAIFTKYVEDGLFGIAQNTPRDTPEKGRPAQRRPNNKGYDAKLLSEVAGSLHRSQGLWNQYLRGRFHYLCTEDSMEVVMSLRDAWCKLCKLQRNYYWKLLRTH